MNSMDIKPNDDVEELHWIALDNVAPENFGLQSIRKGIEKLKTIYKTI